MKLTRSRYDKVALGVCSGIGNYFGWSNNLVRLTFLVGLPLSAGTVLAIYFILGILLPKDY
ncbi:MAG: PspC domain-containing protein [Cytophagales bacterium]|nr:MAG: PspC domain-containing protein [Cytophagales bacterium]TAF61215.1 MAG: PspC domain-containing protein [Cytophagales bacterium]